MMDQKEHPLVPLLRRFVSSPQAIYYLLDKLHREGEIHLTLTKTIEIGNCVFGPFDDEPMQIIIRRNEQLP